MVTRLTRKWWLLALRGMIAFLFGLAALRPGATVTAPLLLFGVYALADGLLALIVSLLDRHECDHWWVPLLRGLAGIAIGMLTFLWPSITAQGLVYVIAAWAILTGAFEAGAVLKLRNVVEGKRQMAWDHSIKRELMRAR